MCASESEGEARGGMTKDLWYDVQAKTAIRQRGIKQRERSRRRLSTIFFALVKRRVAPSNSQIKMFKLLGLAPPIPLKQPQSPRPPLPLFSLCCGECRKV